MLTDHDITEKLLKQLITEKKQELDQFIKDDPQIIKLTNEINDLKQTKTIVSEDIIRATSLQIILNVKKNQLRTLTNYNHEVIKLKTEITALETTLQTITKIKEQPKKTVEKEVTSQPKTFAIIKAIPLLPKPVSEHPLDRPSVDKKINFFHTQTKNFTIKKDYKNNQLSLWDKNNQLVSFSLINPAVDKTINENINSWLDKTLRCSHYYNKLTKIFDKTNKEYFIVTTFNKQDDRIYVKYCHHSKSPNTKSVLHIKKKGKSYIETTKEINPPKDFLKIPLKNNTTLEVSGLGHIGYDKYTLTAQLKHLEKQVKHNDLEKHFENIFNALNKQNHLG